MNRDDWAAARTNRERLERWYQRLEESREELRRREEEQRRQQAEAPVAEADAPAPPEAARRLGGSPAAPQSVPPQDEPVSNAGAPPPDTSPRSEHPAPPEPVSPPGEPLLPPEAARRLDEPAAQPAPRLEDPSGQPETSSAPGSARPEDPPAAREHASPVAALAPSPGGAPAPAITPPSGAVPPPEPSVAARPRRGAAGMACPAAEGEPDLPLDPLLLAHLPAPVRGLLLSPERETAQRYYARPFRETRAQLVRRLFDPLLTLEETARLLNVCPMTVRRYTNRGRLRHVRTAGDQRRFRLSDVLAFLSRVE